MESVAFRYQDLFRVKDWGVPVEAAGAGGWKGQPWQSRRTAKSGINIIHMHPWIFVLTPLKWITNINLDPEVFKYLLNRIAITNRNPI